MKCVGGGAVLRQAPPPAPLWPSLPLDRDSADLFLLSAGIGVRGERVALRMFVWGWTAAVDGSPRAAAAAATTAQVGPEAGQVFVCVAAVGLDERSHWGVELDAFSGRSVSLSQMWDWAICFHEFHPASVCVGV